MKKFIFGVLVLFLLVGSFGVVCAATYFPISAVNYRGDTCNENSIISNDGQSAGLAYASGSSYTLYDGVTATGCVKAEFSKTINAKNIEIEYQSVNSVCGDSCSGSYCGTQGKVRLFSSIDGDFWSYAGTLTRSSSAVVGVIPLDSNVPLKYVLVCRGAGGDNRDNVEVDYVSVSSEDVVLEADLFNETLEEIHYLLRSQELNEMYLADKDLLEMNNNLDLSNLELPSMNKYFHGSVVAENYHYGVYQFEAELTDEEKEIFVSRFYKEIETSLLDGGCAYIEVNGDVGILLISHEEDYLGLLNDLVNQQTADGSTFCRVIDNRNETNETLVEQYIKDFEDFFKEQDYKFYRRNISFETLKIYNENLNLEEDNLPLINLAVGGDVYEVEVEYFNGWEVNYYLEFYQFERTLTDKEKSRVISKFYEEIKSYLRKEGCVYLEIKEDILILFTSYKKDTLNFLNNLATQQNANGDIFCYSTDNEETCGRLINKLRYAKDFSENGFDWELDWNSTSEDTW